MYYLIVIGTFLVLSFILNLILYYKLHRLKLNPNQDAQDILADLLRGNGLIRIERIAPENVFIRKTL